MKQLSTTRAVIGSALGFSYIFYIIAVNPTIILLVALMASFCGLVWALEAIDDRKNLALAASIISTTILFGALCNANEINSFYKSEKPIPVTIKSLICLANPNCIFRVKAHAISTNEELIAKDPVGFVESNMAKLDIELNEYESVNLKALEAAAKENSEITDERIKFYKKYLTDVKTSNYKRNFIRLTLAANTFSLETCNKYNSTEFCADLADLTIPQIEMSESIKLKRLENTGLMNDEETKKYLDLVHDKLDKALDKRPDRVLTDREVNNIFESVPTKQ